MIITMMEVLHMLYIKNVINDDIYSVYKRLSRNVFIVNMYHEHVLITCSRKSPYKVVKV